MKTFNLDAIIDDIILSKNSNEPTSSKSILNFIKESINKIQLEYHTTPIDWEFKSTILNLTVIFNFENHYNDRDTYRFSFHSPNEYLFHLLATNSKFKITLFAKNNLVASGWDYITLQDLSNLIYNQINILPTIDYEKVWESQYKLIEKLRTFGVDQEFLSILLSTYSEYIHSIKNNNQDLIVKHKEFLQFHADLYNLYYPV